MNKKVKSFLKLIVGVAILIFLVYKVGLTNIANTILKMNINLLFPIIIIGVMSFIVGNFNLYILLKPTYNAIKFWRLFKYYVTSCYISFFVPGRIGTTIIIYFLKKEKIKIGKSSALFVLDKILTLSWILILAVPGFFVFLNIKQSLTLITILAFISVIGLYIIFHKHGRNIIKRFILKEYAYIFTGFSKILAQYIKKEKKVLILNYMVTIIRWTLDSICLFLLFISLGHYVNFGFIFITRAVITTITMIPLTSNGLGIREGLAVFFFSKVGVDNSIILSAYLMVLILEYLVLLLLFNLPFQERVSIIKRRIKNK